MRISGRVISEPPMPEAGPAELLGRDDHGEVLGVAALVVAAVLGRHREAEGADLGEALDDVLGHVAVRAVDVLGLRGDDVGGERAERVLHELHVGVEVARARRLGERGDELGIAVRREERMGVAQRRRLDAPDLLAPGEARDEVVDHVGGEGAGDARLGVALGAVVEQRPGRRRARRGVGEVVRQHLVGVGTAGLVEVADRRADHAVGEGDGLGRGRQVRGGGGGPGHGPRLPTGTVGPGIAADALPWPDGSAARRWTTRSRRCSGARPTRACRWRSWSSSTARSSPSATARSRRTCSSPEPAPVDAATPLISWSIAKSIAHAALAHARRRRPRAAARPGAGARVAGHRQGGDHGARPRSRCAPGLAFVEDYVDGESSDVIDMLFGAGAEDHAAYAAAKPLLHPPGTVLELLVGHHEHPQPDHRRRPRRRRTPRRRRARRRRASSSTAACSARSG